MSPVCVLCGASGGTVTWAVVLEHLALGLCATCDAPGARATLRRMAERAAAEEEEE